MLMPVSHAYEIYNPPSPSGPDFYPVITENDAGYAYNLSRITFVTTLVNLTGAFEYNYSEGGTQVVGYYIALGQTVYNEQLGYTAYYVQPVIALIMYGNEWGLIWAVQAWGDRYGYPYDEFNQSGVISSGSGSIVNFGFVFNLTIKATLNSQGQITSAWVHIAIVYPYNSTLFSQTINNLPYPIPDKQVFLEVEEPPGYTFPIIPSNPYVFTNAFASNSTNMYAGPPLCLTGEEFIMQTPYAYASPTLNCYVLAQGVHYYW